jgi:hypothetical protein
MAYVFKAMPRYHQRKVARVARRADDCRKLVHTADAHANANRRVNMLNEFGSVSAARPCALVEQHEHWPHQRGAHQRGDG